MNIWNVLVVKEFCIDRIEANKYWNTLQINAHRAMICLVLIKTERESHLGKEVSREEIRTNKHTNDNGHAE